MGWECGEMNHLSEEQIVLHYYGDAEEAPEIERHLAACSECRAEFARVQSTLKQIEPLEVPEPPAGLKRRHGLTCATVCQKKAAFSNGCSDRRRRNGHLLE